MTSDDTGAPRRYEVTVHGRVQGVGFRWFVRSVAERLGLVGWVANDPSGSVRVVAEGDRASLDELVRLLREGPSGAKVQRVDTESGAARGSYRKFEIRSGGHSGD